MSSPFRAAGPTSLKDENGENHDVLPLQGEVAAKRSEGAHSETPIFMDLQPAQVVHSTDRTQCPRLRLAPG